MIIVFTGDPYLARRALLREAEHKGLSPRFLPPDPTRLQQAASGGLFGPSGALVDLREAAEAEWKALRPALEALPADALVLLLDPKPSAARSRWYKAHAEVRDHPTPKWKDKVRWVENELKSRGLKAPSAVAQYLAGLEGDLEALAMELEKLELLSPPLSVEKVRAVVALEAPLGAFDLVRAVTEGRFREALKLLRMLLARGEEPLRILGALSWQYTTLAKAWALLAENPLLGEKEAAGLLGVHPYAARQALLLAKRLDEARLRAALAALVAAERRAKEAGNPVLALEEVLWELTRLFAPSIP